MVSNPVPKAVGVVVRLRVAPPDVMSVIDIVDTLQLYYEGMSFSQVVSIALRGLLESARQQEVIPTRDGWEYSKMLARFPTEKESLDRVRGKQLLAKRAFDQGHTGEFGKVSSLPQPESESESTVDSELLAHVSNLPDYEHHENIDVRRIYRTLTEMITKKDLDPENFDSELYDRLHSQLKSLTTKTTKGVDNL